MSFQGDLYDRAVEYQDRALTAEAKLRRFEEREPLVQKMLQEIAGSQYNHLDGVTHAAYAAVKDFVLQPSNAPAEQRSGKPNDSQELPGTSTEKPVNAGYTAADVDEALEWADRLRRNRSKRTSFVDGVWHEDVLAAEVLRLREENERIAENAIRLLMQPTAQPAEVRRLRAYADENERAHGYLSRVFLHHAPNCAALPSLLGVCTQIDNLTTRIPELTAERDQLKADLERAHQQVSDLTEQLRSTYAQARRE